MVTAIYFALAALTVFYGAIFLRSSAGACPTPIHALTGFATNFLDTLGIGSFATTTAIFKFGSMVPDRLIPGTLNAGHTLPTVLQAFIYIAVIEVETRTLVLLIAGAVAGLSLRAVRLCVGGALLIAAAALLMRQFELFPAGGNALGLAGWKLLAAVAGNVVFGAVSTLGIGFYAPCMIMVSLMGMNPAAAFPIMMGSSAFLMPVASAQFVRRKAYSVPVALGLSLGGLAGVPLAAFVVKSMPLDGLRWLVIIAVLYAAVLTLRSGEQK